MTIACAPLIPMITPIDPIDGGFFQIPAVVDRLGVAGSYPTVLYKRNGRPIRKGVSAPNGSIIFKNIAYRERGYFAIAHDVDGTPLNGAISDLITPEPMP